MYVVIAGGGKVGEYLAGVLLSSDNDVAMIESDRETADRLSAVLNGKLLVILGDGCDSKYQEDAGIRKADVFVAATGHDDNNLVACEIAMRVFNVPRCIARVNNPKNTRIFREVGIETVSATTLIAKLIEEETMMGSVSAISSLAQDNIALEEITIPKFKNHPDRTAIKASAIHMPTGSTIVAVSSRGETFVVDERTLIHPGDSVIVAADTDIIDRIRNLFKTF